MDPKQGEQRGAPKQPRPGSAPQFGDEPRDAEPKRGAPPEPKRPGTSPDLPDYGDREKSDPRRTNIEAEREGARSVEAPGPDDGPVQSADSPAM